MNVSGHARKPARARRDPRRPHHRHQPRPRARLRAVQSRDPAEGIRVRLPALLPAQPARLPGAGSHRSRQPGAEASSRPTGDLRTDCARYAIYRDGVRVEDRTDITRPLARRFRHLPDRLRHHASTARWSAPASRPTRTAGCCARTLPTEPAGPFHGDMIVTMRWLTAAAGDHRDAGDGAVSLQPRRADPHRRSGGDRRRSRGAAVRRRRCRRRPTASCRCSGPAA